MALKLRPDYPQVWNNKGYALLRLGKFMEAVKSFDKVAQIITDEEVANIPLRRRLNMRR